MLRDTLRTVTRGSATEGYNEFIAPEDARTAEEYWAAVLYWSLRKSQSRYENPFQQEVGMAIEIFEEAGWGYYGEYCTHFFQGRDGEWRQLEKEFALALIERRLDKVGTLSYDEFRKWEEKYPWRDPLSLRRFHERVLETHTEFWHAANILYWYEEYRSHFPRSDHDHWEKCRPSKRASLHALCSAATAGKHIGASAKAIELKQFDGHTMRGIRVAKAARAGGEMAAAISRNDTDERLQEMEKLVAEGESVSDAARKTSKRVGGSPDSNRKLYYRNFPN